MVSWMAESVEEVAIHTPSRVSVNYLLSRSFEGHLSLSESQGYFTIPILRLMWTHTRGSLCLEWHEQVTMFYDVEAWNLPVPLLI